ncbi:hypothetical protein C8J57DRAFT_1233888 [Mycena rebaudengoi]|nr:hypothetical protein C8J57DRAFT_1233888 [Mycena rebaudengoi]
MEAEFFPKMVRNELNGLNGPWPGQSQSQTKSHCILAGNDADFGFGLTKSRVRQKPKSHGFWPAAKAGTSLAMVLRATLSLPQVDKPLQRLGELPAGPGRNGTSQSKAVPG